METKSETKDGIRRKIKILRNQVSLERKAQWDQQIAERFFNLPEMKAASHVFCYIDIRKEAGTRLILKGLWEKNRLVAVPRVIGTEMDFFWIQSLEEAAVGTMGILEPQKGRPAYLQDGTVILIPGLAFGMDGSRLGYGGGYYDRFLGRPGENQKKNCLKIGIAYDFQIFETLPKDPHDCLLDWILTPTQTIVCRRNAYDIN